ncbi:MAG: SIMPL domain-containing protein [Thalassotalea sp.]
MKIITLVFGFLTCFNLFAESIKTPYIHVVGTAAVDVAPDVIHWSLSVNNHGYQLPEVAKQHQAIVATAISKLKLQNIKADSLQTTGMKFGEKTKYVQNNRINDGYFATTNVQFTLVDFEKYQQVWQTMSEIKGLSINAVNFDYSKRKVLQSEMRLKALINARDKAEQMAETLNVTIAEPIAIYESNSGFNPEHKMRVQAMAQDTSQNGSAIEAGKISISSQVEVEFKLVTDINIKKK